MCALKQGKSLRGLKPGGGRIKSIEAWRKMMAKRKMKIDPLPMADGYDLDAERKKDELASCYDKPPVAEHKKDFVTSTTEHFGSSWNPIGSINITIDSTRILLENEWGNMFLRAAPHYGRLFNKLLNKEIEYLNASKDQIRFCELMAELFNITWKNSRRVFPDDAPQSYLGLSIFMREDAVFDLIKSNGPIVLCHPDVQTILLQWLSDKKNAHKKMSRISSALVEYSLGPEMINTRFKPGPADIRILKTNKHEIKQAHQLLTGFLRYWKMIAKNAKKGEPKIKYFEDAINKIRLEIIKSLANCPGKVAARAKLSELNFYGAWLLLLETLKEDATLRGHFESFRWQPNKLAKAIMMKALDISESKMDKALYPNKKLAPIK